MQIDVALDDQGVLQKLIMHCNLNAKITAQFMCITMSALRIMGKLSKIDRSALRQAKSIQEVSKDSILEKWVTNLGRTLEQETAENKDKTTVKPALSYDEELAQLAQKKPINKQNLLVRLIRLYF